MNDRMVRINNGTEMNITDLCNPANRAELMCGETVPVSDALTAVMEHLVAQNDEHHRPIRVDASSREELTKSFQRELPHAVSDDGTIDADKVGSVLDSGSGRVLIVENANLRVSVLWDIVRRVARNSNGTVFMSSSSLVGHDVQDIESLIVHSIIEYVPSMADLERELFVLRTIDGFDHQPPLAFNVC